MNHWLSGGKREDLTLFQMETAIHDAAFNEDGKYSLEHYLRLWRAGSLGPWALKIQWGLCYLKQADIPHMKNRVLIKKVLNVNHDWRLLNDKGMYNKLEAVDDDAEFDVWYCLYTYGQCAECWICTPCLEI